MREGQLSGLSFVVLGCYSIALFRVCSEKFQMPIQVKYFASLRERLGLSEASVDAETVATVQDVWNRATPDQAMPSNLLMAVNHEHAELDHPVKDGDEVAFFPPVTGG